MTGGFLAESVQYPSVSPAIASTRWYPLRRPTSHDRAPGSRYSRWRGGGREFGHSYGHGAHRYDSRSPPSDTKNEIGVGVSYRENDLGNRMQPTKQFQIRCSGDIGIPMSNSGGRDGGASFPLHSDSLPRRLLPSVRVCRRVRGVIWNSYLASAPLYVRSLDSHKCGQFQDSRHATLPSCGRMLRLPNKEFLSPV